MITCNDYPNFQNAISVCHVNNKALIHLNCQYQHSLQSSIPITKTCKKWVMTLMLHPNFRTELKIREFAYSKRILPNPNFVARFGRIRRFGRLYVRKQHSAKRKQLTIINSRLSRTNTESRISGICTSLAELKRKWNKEKHACKTRKQITNQEEKHACKTRKQITNQESRPAPCTHALQVVLSSVAPFPLPHLILCKGSRQAQAS